MTIRKKKDKNITIGEHPNNPGQPDIVGHRKLKMMKMGVTVRGKGIIQSLKDRLEWSKKDLELNGEESFRERRI